MKSADSADNSGSLDNLNNITHEQNSNIEEIKNSDIYEIKNSNFNEVKKLFDTLTSNLSEDNLKKKIFSNGGFEFFDEIKNSSFSDIKWDTDDFNILSKAVEETKDPLRFINGAFVLFLNNDKTQSGNLNVIKHFVSKFLTGSKIDIDSKYTRAFLYRDGIFKDQDDFIAFKLFKESAEEEDIYGMNMLGECYYDGRGTSMDKQMAFEWFQKAAILGNNAARYNLGRMYRDGNIVEKDEEKARELFNSAAEGVNLFANSKSKEFAELRTTINQIGLDKNAEKYEQFKFFTGIFGKLVNFNNS
jgi:hypothetical protein